MRGLLRHRRWLSGWLVAVLLFAQLATAAYACPQLAPKADAATAHPAAIPDCAASMTVGMDPDQPLLCKAHCEAGDASVQSHAAVLDAPPALAVGTALVGSVDVTCAARLAAEMPAAVAAGPPAAALPLYLTLLVLRN